MQPGSRPACRNGRSSSARGWHCTSDFDASTQSLSAIVLEIDGEARRVVFEHALNFDRDLPEYGTSAGVIRGPAGEAARRPRCGPTRSTA